MKNKTVDTDYLHTTARVRSLERSFLSSARMERMLEARTDEEALKVLAECGYGEISPSRPDNLTRALTENHRNLLDFWEGIVPDRRIVDIFRLKYDYHNVKAFLKSEASYQDADRLFLDFGRVKVKMLTDILRRKKTQNLPPVMCAAAEEARVELARAGDPRKADIILDHAYYKEMLELASATNSAFMLGYATLLIDLANMRIIVRTSRIGLGVDFLRSALIEGGSMDINRLIAIALSDMPLSEHFSEKLHELAAAAGTHAMREEMTLSEFEKEVDNVRIKYLKSAKFVAFGEQPLVAYIAVREAEIIAIRTIMSGRRAGAPRDLIRERLREAYV